MNEREAARISQPGQCCSGYCIESIGVHGLRGDDADWVAARLAALVAQARSDALAPVLAFADQWHHPDHGGSCWGCAVMRAAASSHPTGNQP